MIRFILKRKTFCAHDGRESERHFTIDCDVPELERALTYGGYGESGYDETTFVGVEVRQEPAKLDGGV